MRQQVHKETEYGKKITAEEQNSEGLSLERSQDTVALQIFTWTVRALKELSHLVSCLLMFHKNQPKSSFAKNRVEKGSDK